MTSWQRKAACAGFPLSLFFGGEEERRGKRRRDLRKTPQHAQETT